MTTLQERMNEARVELETRVQNYPIQVQGFMWNLLWERAAVLLQRQSPPPAEWAYPNYHDLVIDMAEPRVAPIHSDGLIGVMEERQCYRNCFDVIQEHAGYTYVEGYAQTQFMIVRHAWLENDEGVIIDPTWANLDHPAGFLASYIGVKFDDTFLIQHVVETGWHSVFESDFQSGHQVLKRGLLLGKDGKVQALGDPRE